MKWIIEDEHWDGANPHWADYSDDMARQCADNCRFRRGEAYLPPGRCPRFTCALFDTPLGIFCSSTDEDAEAEGMPPAVMHYAERCEECINKEVRICGERAVIRIEVECEREPGHEGEHACGSGQGQITWR